MTVDRTFPGTMLRKRQPDDGMKTTQALEKQPNDGNRAGFGNSKTCFRTETGELSGSLNVARQLKQPDDGLKWQNAVMDIENTAQIV